MSIFVDRCAELINTSLMTNAETAAAAFALESELLAHGVTLRAVEMWTALKPHVTPAQARSMLTVSLKPRKIGRKVRFASAGLYGPQTRACPIGAAISAVRYYHEGRAELDRYAANQGNSQ